MLWRLLYRLAWWLALPLAFVYLWRRGRQQPAYRRHWTERLGIYPPHQGAPLIWLHAVSVGETRAALPLIRALQQRHPGHRILLTQMTPTGRDTARTLLGDEVLLAYLPYDLPGAVRRFLRHYRPAFGVLLEMELWPTLLLEASAQGVPVYLVNARLSARSWQGYRRVRGLLAPALRTLSGVAAQAQADADRLHELGAPSPLVAGNIKFDFEVDAAMQARGRHWRTLFGSRPVWVAASTREGEEAMLLAALSKAALPPDTLLLLVPRHPQRFDELAGMLDAAGLPFMRRSAWPADAPLPAEILVMLGDSMGEMTAYYAAADVAFVGGSLVDVGGQSLIEPCAQGLPVLMGPSCFNFAEAAKTARELGALRQCDNADTLMAELATLLADPAQRQAMGEAGHCLMAANRGALARVMTLLP
ncbi:lipid IV(A) 3-deoxy-D-manno-octulosonic acid transferase [Chitinimonas sp. BJYL2]|uniref:lipid IV(A) 3-deoxy-D-manno-octulosonic acid transferase n=1 Tax=Chitinimonas sp. BJYL2 TaxID=2976696 RepID=UPI0022B3CBB0|nr:lipid IV(A) 3-deoxy-D-manno-octulosonic acid transferase [Chitinimonas sp. BJYL2]